MAHACVVCSFLICCMSGCSGATTHIILGEFLFALNVLVHGKASV